MNMRWFAAVVALLFLALCHQIAVSVAMGALLAYLVFPAYEHLLKKTKSASLSAVLVTSGLTVVVLLPVSLILIIGVRALVHKTPELKFLKETLTPETLSQLRLVQVVQDFSLRWFGLDIKEVIKLLQDAAENVAGAAATQIGDLLAQIPALSISLVVAILSLFFLLMDGGRLIKFIRSIELIPQRQFDILLKQTGKIGRALVLAMILVAMAQSIIFALGCLIAGVSNVALLGFVSFLMAFIPLVGAMPLTFGVAVYLFIVGRTGAGIIVLIFAILASTVDNFIRPWVLRGGAGLHPLLAFMGVFGGLQILGFPGLFLGPILAGIFLNTFLLLKSEASNN